jgi:hypothetical protein
MRAVCALRHELGQCRLRMDIGRQPQPPLHGTHRLGAAAGRYHPADPQARQQALRRAAETDHLLGIGQRGEGRDAPALPDELAVVIVLDDHRAGVTGRLEQDKAAAHRHPHAGGVLGGGRDVDQPRSRRNGPRGVGAQGIHRQRTATQARRLQGCTGADVARALDQRDFSRIGENGGGDHQARLRAGGDDDILGRADKAAMAVQLVGQHLPQLG